MSNSADILKLRVLLCFLKSDTKECTVTGMAKTLNVEKYAVSRALSALEKDQYINRDNIRNPILTEKGLNLANHYSERLKITLNHLLYEGVDIENAQKDAFNWALYCSDKTMDVIRATEERYRVKYELRDQKQFSAATLCKKLSDGYHQFPFLICKEHAESGNNLSMANEGFEHPCDLYVENGVGTIILRSKMIHKKSPTNDNLISVQATELKYFDYDQYVSAESNGPIFSFPVDALNFINIGSGAGQILYGSAGIQIETSCEGIHKSKTNAIFTILI